MSDNPTSNSVRSRFWKSIFVINMALSIWMLVISLTNLTFPGTWPNYVFPPVIGCATLLFLFRFLLPVASNKLRRLATLSSFPAIVCGCLPPLLMLCLIIPPFTLGFFFAIDETLHEQRIQSAVSPNGTKVAEVYFRGVGAYSGGNGRVTVRVHSRFFPFVEWEVFYNSHSIADENTNDYVQSWYKNELSKSPWRLEWVKSHQDQDTYQSDDFDNPIIEGYCLYATKSNSDGQTESFYVEVFGDSDEPIDTHINVGTPNPITDHCSRYVK